MSDDICGQETADGEPCQNPASEGDSCWIPSHGGSADAGHRQSKFNEKRATEAKEAARDGMSKAGCARAAGVDKATLERWLDSNESFRNAFTRARHKGERKLVTGPLMDEDHGPDMDGQHARFLLSTSFDYIKTERTEVTGEDGGAVETEVVIGGEDN